MVGGLERSPPRGQFGPHRDRAVLHAGRLVAGSHAEEIAECQHAGAGLDLHRLVDAKGGQVLGVDLQHGHFQPRVGAQQAGLESGGRR